MEEEENQSQSSVNTEQQQMRDIPPEGANEQLQNTRKRSEEKKKIKVLVYDIEKGETTICFIEALKKHLRWFFEFQDFHEAEDEERETLSIIAIVRHTSIRMTEILGELKVQLAKEKVKDLERVFVIYFYVNKSDEGCVHKIAQISESGQFDFATIVSINFISDSGLLNTFRDAFGYKWYHKTGNKESLQTLKRCIQSRRKLCVNVFGAMDRRVKAFRAELNKHISSSIELQAVKPLYDDHQINETAPTLICTTGDADGYKKKIKVKDLKKVFLCHIIDFENISTRPVMHDSPDTDAKENTLITQEEQNPSSTLSAGAGNNTTQNAENMPSKMYEILYYNGKFKFDLDFIKKFETFVRTWSEEIKPPSE